MIRFFQYIHVNIRVRFRQHLGGKGSGGSWFVGLITFIPYLTRLFSRLLFFPRKNLIYGKGYYHLPVLVTFPRSGTNWIRYIIESMTGQPTPGKVRLHSGKDYAVDRAHSAMRNGLRYKKMILVLRDYRECLIRHHLELFKEIGDVKLFMENDVVTSRPAWYLQNVHVFHQFQGEKLLMYYEDLLENPEVQIKKLGHFLGAKEANIQSFVGDLKNQQSRSIDSYHSSHHSVTAGDTSKKNFHADSHLTKQEQLAFDNYFRNKSPELWDAYLARYSTQKS
ncbi:MAG: sulfotransferase domain-containing protein [Cyclobacteriaceae bacterium]